MITVHILYRGHTLCEHSTEYGIPRDWPAGHKWVGLDDVHQLGVLGAGVTCQHCYANYLAFKNRGRAHLRP